MPTKNYTVEWAESKPTSTGKPRKIVTLKDETGAHYENVTLWGDFPGWEGIGPGSSVQGDYKDDGKYRTLFPTRAPRAARGPTGENMRGVAAAQTRKGDMIEKAQDAKGRGIQVAAAYRDCTLMVLEMARTGHFDTDEEKNEFIQRKHKELVSWYLKQWDMSEQVVDQAF